MKNTAFILSVFVTAVFVVSCGMPKETRIQSAEKPALVSFLDSTEAAEAIVADDIDGFYNQLSDVEIQIQMKKPGHFSNHDQALQSYKQFIRTEVSHWSTAEKESLFNIFLQVKSLCDSLSPRLFPDGIRLIKVKTNHYGNDVYYTRGKNIMVPENIFPLSDASRQLPVMIHEVFHVLSRYNPQLKEDLYQLIGFVKADKPVRLNAQLNEIVLSNPDGVSHQFVINMTEKSPAKYGVPLITSKYNQYKPSMPVFFDYLNFDLYAIEDKGTYYEVVSDKEGKTTMPLQNTPVFFSKIKDNTQYIIHPDEILADNFMLSLLAVKNNDFKRFSKDGRMLIDKIISRLKTF